MKNLSKNSGGFTIIELLMATAVFSLVLMAAVVGFIQVGKMFYKGIEIGKTQDAAGNILDSVASDLHLLSSGNFPSVNLTNSVVEGDNRYGYVCIGVHRYSFFLGQDSASTNLVDLSAPVTNQVGLIRDTLTGPGCPDLTQMPLSSASQQMLGDGMTLGKFYISQTGGAFFPFYIVKITVGFGDNGPGGVFDTNAPIDPDALAKPNQGAPGAGNYQQAGLADTKSLRCRGLLGTNFCAVTNIDTYINPGLGLH